MHRLAAAPLLLAAGCFGWAGDGGQSGTEVPDTCAIASRTPLTDLSAPSDGFAFSPQDVVDAIAGDWSGDWLPTAGPRGTASATIGVDRGSFARVDQVLVTHPRDTGPATEGAPDAPPPDCSPYYAATVTFALTTADGTLADAFSGELDARALDGLAFGASRDAGDVAGTTHPTSFVPAEWDHSALALDASYASAAWTGAAAWQAWNDPPAADTDTGNTGTIAVSGMTEGVGSFTLGR